ncbi:hypothetical protein SAMN05192559_104154 [Halobacillus karajensis]|uniref:YneQ n=1 Tax=Halobacillus karajensis TaxID=195088 RepID=A0A024P2E0_9BACI|nr:hypothetical protein [Halobacillus karajensis]CDQ19621.1 hypothetical protein BN982_01920 [Halobacillus karajensis]CDQ22081.1 hypothetical protein BN983_00281 [Halobacillus karajensis]CDQ27922.1 hypothetical protein BN981_02208 [Halobacillus karajensis]SEH79393.1 hypothetical protein SAMN05192559_104154 [Halobacillus karajensis]
MAFGVKREELRNWKSKVKNGEIAILTHYWLDERFPDCDTVTKVGCNNMKKLKEWGEGYGLAPEWIHKDPQYPHFDLFGDRQVRILRKEQCWEQIDRFRLDKK